MRKLIMTEGLPASGKTSWAQEFCAEDEYHRIIVCKDTIRKEHPDWNEKKVIAERDRQIHWYLQVVGENGIVISADTNLNPIHRVQLRSIAVYEDAEFEVKSFAHVPLDECIKRDFKRQEGRVGEKAIRQMHNQYIRPTLTVAQDPQLPFAIISDLDGTLALLNGRNPYNASDCEYDKLNGPVWNCIRKYMDDGYQLIITSGRSSKYLEQTNRWLGKHGIYPDLFLMRKEGDDQKDYTLKRDMFLQHIYNKYYVEVVFDDRERIVDCWRDLGLACFAVADGKF